MSRSYRKPYWDRPDSPWSKWQKRRDNKKLRHTDKTEVPQIKHDLKANKPGHF
jgi:hypothetical protein